MYIQLHCTVCLKRAPSVLRKPSCWRFFECHVISRGPYTGFNGSCLPHPSLQRYLAQCTIQWERGKIAKKYSRRADPIASIREVTRSVRQELAVTAVFVLIFFFFFLTGSLRGCQCTCITLSFCKADSKWVIQCVAWQRTLPTKCSEIYRRIALFGTAACRRVRR